MKTLKYISALLVVASTLLPSCMLLDSSPIHSYGPHFPFAASGSSHYGWGHHRANKVYKGSFEVPAEGGIYEIECGNDNFYISRIFDSSMTLPQNYSNCRYSPTADDFESVNDLTYSGPFYTITCNKDKHNWVIKVDPFIALADEINYREVRVSMWDGSDNSNLVFQFEQNDDGNYGCIE